MSHPAPAGSRRAAMGGMSGRGVAGRDEDAQRALNAEAPDIPDLWPRVIALFSPYKRPLTVTAVLVVGVASASVIPAASLSSASSTPRCSRPRASLGSRCLPSSSAS